MEGLALERGIGMRWLPQALRWLPLGLFLSIWQATCPPGSRQAFFFSSPSAVTVALISDLRSGALPSNILFTGMEALSGFLLGNLVGTSLGILLWFSPRLALASKPYLVALGATPVFALAPMTIIWFGVGIGAKVALAFLGTVFVAAAQAFRGAEQVDPLHLRRLKVFGATNLQVYRWLLLPSSAIWVISALRLTVGGALLGAFIGEFIAADRGLGYMIVRAAGLYDTARVLSGVLMIVLLAVGMDRLIDAVQKRVVA